MRFLKIFIVDQGLGQILHVISSNASNYITNGLQS